MKRPPRNPDKVFFGRRKIGISALEGLLLMAVVLILYFLSLKEGHSIGEVRAIAFSSLIIGNIFLALTSMSKTRSFLSVIIEGNITVIVILLVAFLMLVLILMLPSLLHIFSFEFTSFKHFYPSLIGSFVMLLILETVKYIRITQRVN